MFTNHTSDYPLALATNAESEMSISLSERCTPIFSKEFVAMFVLWVSILFMISQKHLPPFLMKRQQVETQTTGVIFKHLLVRWIQII